MRKSRLVILPTKCLNRIGFLLLFLSCPVIGDWGRIQPESEASHNAIQIAREGTCGIRGDLFGGLSSFSKDHNLGMCQFGALESEANLKVTDSPTKSIQSIAYKRVIVQDEGEKKDSTQASEEGQMIRQAALKSSEARSFVRGKLNGKFVRKADDTQNFQPIQTSSLKNRFSRRITVSDERIAKTRSLTRNEANKRISRNNINSKEWILRNNLARREEYALQNFKQERRLQDRRSGDRDSKTFEKERRRESTALQRKVQHQIRNERFNERNSRKEDIRRNINENGTERLKREAIRQSTRINNNPGELETRRFDRSIGHSSHARRENNDSQKNVRDVRIIVGDDRLLTDARRIFQNQARRMERETVNRMNARNTESKMTKGREWDIRENPERITKLMRKLTNEVTNARRSDIRHRSKSNQIRATVENPNKNSDLTKITGMTRMAEIVDARRQNRINYFEDKIKRQMNIRNDEDIHSQNYLKKTHDTYSGQKLGEWTLNCIMGVAVYYFSTTQLKIA